MAEENEMNQGNTGGGAAADITGKFESSKTHVRRAAEDFRTAAGEIAGEYRGRAEQAWDDAQNRVRTLQEDGEQYVRENPTKAVFTALGIGFILGIIFRR
ncbi:MAG: YqjD family protein [Chthoniobacterales bacterium]